MNTTVACLALSFSASPILPNSAQLFSSQLTRFTAPVSAFGFSAAQSSFSHFLAPVLAVSATSQQAFVNSAPALASVFSDCTFTSIATNCIYVNDISYSLTVERCGFSSISGGTSPITIQQGSTVSLSSLCFESCTCPHPGYVVCTHSSTIYYCTVNNTNELSNAGVHSSFAGGMTYLSFYYNNVTKTTSSGRRAGFCFTRSAVDNHHCKYNTCIQNSGSAPLAIYHPGSIHIECFAFIDNMLSEILVEAYQFTSQLTLSNCLYRGNNVPSHVLYLGISGATVTFAACSFDYPQFGAETGVTVGSDCVFGTVGTPIVYPTFNPSVCYALGSPVATSTFTVAHQTVAVQSLSFALLFLQQ